MVCIINSASYESLKKGLFSNDKSHHYRTNLQALDDPGSPRAQGLTPRPAISKTRIGIRTQYQIPYSVLYHGFKTLTTTLQISLHSLPPYQTPYNSQR